MNEMVQLKKNIQVALPGDYEMLRFKTVRDGGVIVLAGSEERNEYATWWCDTQRKACFHGHYTFQYGDAIADFEARN